MTISPDGNADEAALLMAKESVGSIVVVGADGVVGMLARGRGPLGAGAGGVDRAGPLFGLRNAAPPETRAEQRVLVRRLPRTRQRGSVVRHASARLNRITDGAL